MPFSSLPDTVLGKPARPPRRPRESDRHRALRRRPAGRRDALMPISSSARCRPDASPRSTRRSRRARPASFTSCRTRTRRSSPTADATRSNPPHRPRDDAVPGRQGALQRPADRGRGRRHDRACARRREAVRVRYETASAVLDFDRAKPSAYAPKKLNRGPADTKDGDVDGALAGASVRRSRRSTRRRCSITIRWSRTRRSRCGKTID